MKFHRDLLQSKNNASNANKYFSIKFLGNNGTITFTPSSTTINELEYNVLGDNKWMDWKISSGKFTLSQKKKGLFVAGDIVMIRAKEGKDYSNAYNGAIGKINVNVGYAVFGNLMSIIKDGCKSFTGTVTLASMFKNQTNLKMIGNDGDSIDCLPAKSLPANCYSEMFSGCTHLTNTPAFTANATASKSCYQMFYGCTGLTSVSSININASGDNSCEQMFYNCIRLTDASNISINSAEGNKCCYQMFVKCDSLSTTPTINSPLCGAYAFNETFYNCTSLTNVSNVTIGDMVSATGSVYACYKMFYGCTRLTTPPSIATMQTSKYCFLNMFAGCTGLTAAPELPATTLADYCYCYMFSNGDNSSNRYKTVSGACTNIKTAGQIGSDDGVSVGVSSCEGMFAGCSSLHTAPRMKITAINSYGCCEMFKNALLNTNNKTIEIKATGEYSYCGMFLKCGLGSTFISPVDELPGVTTKRCYSHMYFESAITKTPKLYLESATSNCCELMFANCSALYDAQDIIIEHTASKSCYAMFYGTNLSVSLPILCATTVATYAYQYMFNKCNNLKSLPSGVTYTDKNSVSHNISFLPATTLSTYCYYAMFGNADNANIETVYSSSTTIRSLPAGLTSIPNNLLPATTLKSYCYAFMFASTGIESIPDGNYSNVTNNSFLPAKKLKDYCYYCMFQLCKQLKSTTQQLIEHVTPANMDSYCYSYMFYNCSALRYNSGNYSIPTLNTTNEQLPEGCYSYMFCNCTNFNPAGAGEYLDSDNRLTYLPQYTLLGSKCYQRMFASSDIKHYPILPATTLNSYCYSGMFYNCDFADTKIPDDLFDGVETLAGYCYEYMFASSNITYISKLPVMHLTTNCYAYMFSDCTGLTSAPELPSTELATYCYQYMFNGCTGLTSAPELPATTLYNCDSCYQYMFNGCTRLTTAPELPATTLERYCYSYMFANTGLTTPPSLPATTLKDHCYQYMFGDCTSLITTPSFSSITKLADYCFYYMFTNCIKLNTITDLPNEIAAYSYAYSYMFNNCGALQTIPDFTTIPNNSGAYSHMFYNCSQLTDASKVIIGHTNNEAGTQLKNYCYQYMFANCPLTVGLPQMDYENGYNVYDYCFSHMFDGCGFEIAPKFKISKPGATNSYGGCQSMFINCKSLIDASTVEIACHCGANASNNITYGGCTYMFSGCTALTTGPIISATTLANYCFGYMFSGCTALTTAPDLSSVTTLADNCYTYMFSGCTALTTAPDLSSVTTLKTRCYSYMFRNCSSLTVAPELPTMALADNCYSHMFEGCNNLTTAPELPATILANYCYEYMFWNCSGLTTAPTILPATTLKYYCYYHMFDGCTSLTTAPELPATSLTSYCYDNMFRNCTSLKNVKAMFTTRPDTVYTYYWLPYGSSGAKFIGNKNATWLTDLINGAEGNVGRSYTTVPYGWTIEQV